MPELTLKAIEDLLDLKLEEKLEAQLKPLHAILDRHTSQIAWYRQGRIVCA